SIAYRVADRRRFAAPGGPGAYQAASVAALWGEADALAGGDGARPRPGRLDDLLSWPAPHARIARLGGRTQFPRHRRAVELDGAGAGRHIRADCRICLVVGCNPRHVN